VTKECAPKDEAREAVDELLLQNGFAEAKPILCICYGLQSLNVWRRGTLIQDLPHAEAAKGPTVNHQPGREVQRAHSVLITPGSRLSHVVAGAGENEQPGLFVNSSHHQAIDRPGEALMVTARSPADGIIEALEAVNPSQFLVAVQWHPERSYESSAASRALFKAFLEAARQWSGPKATLDSVRPCTH
jgi:putative glutamine amidotransferase